MNIIDRIVNKKIDKLDIDYIIIRKVTSFIYEYTKSIIEEMEKSIRHDIAECLDIEGYGYGVLKIDIYLNKEHTCYICDIFYPQKIKYKQFKEIYKIAIKYSSIWKFIKVNIVHLLHDGNDDDKELKFEDELKELECALYDIDLE